MKDDFKDIKQLCVKYLRSYSFQNGDTLLDEEPIRLILI